MTEQSKIQKSDSRARANDSAKRDRGPTEDEKGSETGDSEGIGSMLATQAKNLMGSEVTKRTHKSAHDLASLSKALRLTSEQLDGNLASPYVERAAKQLQRLSEFVETADAGALIGRAEDLARRRPVVFMSVAMLLGFGGARFLKSSSRHRAGQSDSDARGKKQPRKLATTRTNDAQADQHSAE